MPVKFSQTQYPLQNLPTGETTYINAYRFEGEPGPAIYIQANLHGPEIIGTPLVGLLITYLKTLGTITGSITLVPCANPLGVKESSTALDGRWNKKSGYNWNRIFATEKKWQNSEEKFSHYQDLLEQKNLSIEDKLTAILHSIAGTPDYVIDLHCCGIETCNYLFTFPECIDAFKPFDTRLCVSVDKPGFAEGSFMGSFYTPFSEYPGSKPKVCTWEVGGDQQVDRRILDERWQQLKSWIDMTLCGKPKPEAKQTCIHGSISDFMYIHSHQSGYFIWEKEVGELVAAHEPYITYYDPATNTFTQYAEERPFLFISKYTLAAVGEGEQIGELLWC